MINDLKLLYPIKPASVSQPFGVNGSYYQENGINIVGHNGIDFRSSHGEPVYAAHDGSVLVEVDENQGHGVVLFSDVMFNVNGVPSFVKTIYWHLINDIYVKNGQHVRAGDYLGHADSTGLSTGDHLHFGLKPVAQGEPPQTWYNTQQNNGYLGCIDPSPFFSGMFAEDVATSRYPFEINMGYGDSNEEVRQLQIRLQKIGLFPMSQTATGLYGPKTSAAVLQFQLQYHVDDVNVLKNLGGRSCGPKTRKILNSI